MAKYELTTKAVEDLNSIWEYTFDKWTESQADNYYHFLLNSCQKIANKPSLGRNYAGIANNLFGFKANRHIIFYRVIENMPIEITRILHGRMDLKNRILQ